MTETIRQETEKTTARKPKPWQNRQSAPARLRDEFREPKDEADLLPIDTIVEEITRKPNPVMPEQPIEEQHTTGIEPQKASVQQTLRMEKFRQAVETNRVKVEPNQTSNADISDRREVQSATNTIDPLRPIPSLPVETVAKEPERMKDTVSPMQTVKPVPHTTQSQSEPIKERMKTQGIQTTVQKARSTMDKAQELAEQPAEDSPSDYAEKKVEQSGMEAVHQAGAVAETIGTHVRQETIRHFSRKREEDRMAEDEQTQSTAEDRNNDLQEAAQEPVGPDANARNEQPTEPKPQHETATQKETERASQQRTARSFTEKEGGKPDAQGQANGSSAQSEEAKNGIPRSDFHGKNGTVSPAQRLISGTEEKANAAPTSNHAVRQTQQTVRMGQRPVKIAEQTEKTVKQTGKATQQTAKTAQKSARASAKAAQIAKETSQKTAQATAKAGKAAGKALAAAIKAIIEAGKALVTAILEGGWMAVLIVVMIAVIALILVSSFGLFFSNDVSDGRPMTEAIQEINGDFVDSIQAQINRYKRQYKPDEVELVYEGDTDSDGSVMNWPDVLGIYAVSTTTDPEQPTDVLIITDEKEETLRTIFRRMNSVSYQTEVETEEILAVDDHGNPVFDDEGKRVMEEETTLTITIRVSSMDYREAAALYGFDENQNEMLREMMRPAYYPLFAELTGDVIGDGGEYGFGLDINPDLPPSELGYKIVEAAKRYIGRSYASMDCSKFARTAYADVGLTSMNGLSSVRMAEKCRDMGCLFTDPSQLQAGDLIFFARYDPSRGKDYCGDTNRCGTGKCRRWLHIHHVAIYINDQYLIDSTGGDNSVQIRKHYGQNTARWKWVCFGRPTT